MKSINSYQIRIGKTILAISLMSMVSAGLFLTGLMSIAPMVSAAISNAVITTEQELRDAIANAPGGYSSTPFIIQFGDNVSLSPNSTISILVGRNIAFTGGSSLTGASGKSTLIVENGGTLTLDGITVSHNDTSGDSCGVTVNYGGKLYLNSGNISGNTSEFGGGGVSNWGAFEMLGGAVLDNEGATGGGVYNRGMFKMSGGVISDNTTGNFVILMLDGWGFFNRNGGGGVYNTGTFTMLGGMIANNTTKFNGGGVYNIPDATFNMLGGAISGNNANLDGGVCIGGTFNLSGGEICGNTASYGGGMYIAGSEPAESQSVVNMFGTACISSNIATYDGSGVYNDYGGIFNLADGTIDSNTAGNNGGGVFNRADIAITGGFLSSNNASNGGAVYNYSGVFNYSGSDEVYAGFGPSSAIKSAKYKNGSFNMSGCTISGNEATFNGGGIYFDTTLPINYISQSMSISSSTIEGNVAGESGGGIWITHPSLKELFIDSAKVPNSTVFSNNFASNACNRLSQDNATYASNILTNEWSDLSAFGYFQQGYNNFDISYSTYPIPYYTVTYLPGEHGDFAPQIAYNLRLGDPIPNAQFNPAQHGWRFNGWLSKDALPLGSATVSGNITYVALWERISLVVAFVDWDGKLIKIGTVLYGDVATMPSGAIIGSKTMRSGYTFTGWESSYQGNIATVSDGFDLSDIFARLNGGVSFIPWFFPISGHYEHTDIVFTAQYIPTIMYEVVFRDWDDTLLSREYVESDGFAVSPLVIGDKACRPGYIFIGWDSSFDSVTSDMTVKALYKPYEAQSILKFNLIIGGCIFLMVLVVLGGMFVVKRKKLTTID